MAGAAKAAVAETFAQTGTWPDNNAAAGMGAATDITGKYVTSISLQRHDHDDVRQPGELGDRRQELSSARR